ncbi:hypothetical protein [Agromyces sp. Marseille-Q5079]|uniref:hypothetical protein n=1 Tax=Agromyces sp. Marseille-Q5079 TaxID=3439059 RepID=UPI003D9CAE24
MSDRDAADIGEPLTERYPTPRRRSFLATAAITLAVLGVGFAILGFTPGILVALYGGMIAAYVALPYTLLAIIVREVVARRGQGGGDDEPRNDEAIRFGLFRQRASFVTAIVMLVAIVILVVMANVSGSVPGGSGPFGGGLAVFGAFAVFAGAFAIVVNAPSIYSAPIVRSERYAVRQRIGAWRLILATTILTTLSWLAYCGFGVFFVTQSM